MLLNINLLPKTKKEESRDKRYKYLATVIFVAVLGGTLAGVGAMYSFKSLREAQEKKANERLATAQAEEANLKETKDKLLLLKKQIDAVNKADANKLSAFFDHIDKVTLSYIQFANFSVSGDGTITISADAKDYDNVAKFVTSMKEEFPGGTTFTGATKDEENGGKVTFSITIKFDQNYLNTKVNGK